jgi:hypothetical protein
VINLQCPFPHDRPLKTAERKIERCDKKLMQHLEFIRRAGRFESKREVDPLGLINPGKMYSFVLRSPGAPL